MSTALANRPGMQLQAAINLEHSRVVGAGSKMVEHAVKCGNLLIEAKGTVPHGGWTDWVTENFEGSEWTAQQYMRLAREEAANPGRVKGMDSIRTALKALAPAKHPEPAGPVAKIDPGTAAGKMLASARTLGQVDEELIVEAHVVEIAPSGVDERRWNASIRRMEDVRRCMNEAVVPGLTAEAAAEALQDASTAARQTAIDLEQMAAAARRRAA